MTARFTSNLEETIRDAGEAWLIDFFEPSEEAVSHLRLLLERVTRRAKERLEGNAPDLSEHALVKAYNEQPAKVRAFLQILGGTRTPDMLLMAWRIIQGMEIKNVELQYRRQQEFQMRIVLESPYGEEDEAYESSNIQDFALFRHVGIMEIGDKPVFEGFYPLKVR